MKKKHTPGPWEAIEHNWSDTSIYSTKGECIASLSIRGEATEETQEALEEEQTANATLIAAAPELLEALELAVKHFTASVIYDQMEEDAEKVFNALKKATL